MGDRPLRVLLVAPSPRLSGGQAVQAQLLARGLAEVGVRVQLLPIDLPLPRPLRGLERLAGVRTAVRALTFAAHLAWQVPRCDVVHAFSAAYLSFLLWPVPAVLLGRLCGKRTILNYRSGEGPGHLARWGLVARPLLRWAGRVVVPSGYLRDVFAEHGVRAQVVSNVVDLAAFRYRERARPRPVILVARALEPLYNIPCALRAFQPVRAAYPRAELWIAGDGSQRGALERLVEEQGGKGVRFLGRVEHEQMPDLYDQADLLLNTPNLDNMPVSLLEAFASGLPVVSTVAGGIPYLVDSGINGLLAPVDDSEGLAGHLLWMLEHPEAAREMARRARERCAQFTWPRVAQEWLAVYRGRR